MTQPPKDFYPHPLKQVKDHVHLSGCRFLQPKKIKRIEFNQPGCDAAKYGQLEFQSNQISLLVLLSSDGATSHAITITNGWIFDSNETVALPLTQVALDYCTWDETSRTTCIGFHSGWVFTDHCNKMARRKRHKEKVEQDKKKRSKMTEQAQRREQTVPKKEIKYEPQT